MLIFEKQGLHTSVLVALPVGLAKLRGCDLVLSRVLWEVTTLPRFWLAVGVAADH